MRNNSANGKKDFSTKTCCGVILLCKKILVIVTLLCIFLLVLIPSGAKPAKVWLDQPVEFDLPGTFVVTDFDQDHKGEALKFFVTVRAYRDGQALVTANLEGNQKNRWFPIATTVVSMQWAPGEQVLEVTFPAYNIIRSGISGPYRVKLGLKESNRNGGWEYPPQIVGISPRYPLENFSTEAKVESGIITTAATARRAVETWAYYRKLELGTLKKITFDYDRWQIDFLNKHGERLRFFVAPNGVVESLTREE